MREDFLNAALAKQWFIIMFKVNPELVNLAYPSRDLFVAASDSIKKF